MKCLHNVILSFLLIACGTDSQPPSMNEDTAESDVALDLSIEVADAVVAVADAMVSEPMPDGEIGPGS